MKHFLLIVLLAATLSCGVKKTTNSLNSGNYDQAISSAVQHLKGNKNAKSKQVYVYLLEEAFAKAKERDLRNINLWSKDANPSNLENIFKTYVQLNQRQEKIRPLLPLRFLKENKNAQFPFDDYSSSIVDSKTAYSDYLYTQSKQLLRTASKLEARSIFDNLNYLNRINPGYRDVKNLIAEAQFKGTDYVHVYTKNESNMLIPNRLQNDLLDFSTYGLNDKWTVYHSNRAKDITYDYGISINFREIVISPEQIREKEFEKEKQIKDGVKNLVDANGNFVRDSLGKPIKVDKFITVKAVAYEITQFKACQVVAKVDYVDFNTNQLIHSYPLASEFVFEHMYATVRGDRRAFDEQYLPNFGRKAVPFPSNEQMVYDAGEDVKMKLKEIVSRNRIRR